MPANTVRLALPYPLPDDSVDVPRDVQALAAKLDGLKALAPPTVTDLPAGAAEGDEVVLSFTVSPVTSPATAPQPMLWRVRYTGGWWVPLGAVPVCAIERSQIVTSAIGWNGTGPQVSIPFAGDYLLRATAGGQGSNNPYAAVYQWGFGNNTKAGAFPANNYVAPAHELAANRPYSGADTGYALDQGRGEQIIHGHQLVSGNLPVISGVRAVTLTPIRLKAV